MVAIVAGNGLGLERSSSNILGGRGQLGSAVMGRANENVTVNAATGNLIIQNTDELLIGRGPDAVLNRTYNSLGTYTNLAGAADPDNWLTNTQRKIVLAGTGNAAGSTATLTDWDGTVIVFNWVSAAVGYKAAENPYRDDTLTWTGNVFTWTEGKSRTVQTFATNIGGRLESAADADGNAITYTYDAVTTAGKLTRVTTANSTGSQFNYTDLTYTGTNLTSLVTSYYDTVSATNKTLTRTLYAYDATNRLTSVTVDLSPGDNLTTDNIKFVTAYTYAGTSKRVASIRQGAGATAPATFVAIAYDASNRVATITQTAASGDTRVTSFAYDTVNRITTITDPLLNVSKMTYDVAGRLTRVEEPAPIGGGLPSITDYTYNATGDVMTAFVTEGIGGTAIARDFYQYDANGNATQLYRWTGADYRVTRWTYGTKNELLTETVFANVDADGDGGVAPTGAETTRYAYDTENHLRFMVSSEGRVTEYRYDAPGNLIATISYSGTLYSTAGHAENVSIAESTLATWVSGTADKAQTQRTDSVYDFRGNITTSTGWSQTDSAGNGVTTANWSRMSYVYDQFGKLLSRLISGTNDLGGEPTYTAESFVYDGFGRMISMVDIYGVATSIAINDGTRVTTVTTANDVTRTSTVNIAGELISYRESGTGIATGTTLYAYDKLGRLRIKTDPLLVKTYYVYDKQSRLTAEIDADGSMTEFKYDAADRMIASVRYAVAVSAANITTLDAVATNTEVATVRPPAAATDRWSWNIYDKSDKLIETIDAIGAVAKLDYDGAGRLVKTTRYNALLAAATVTGFKTTLPTALTLPAADASVDRVVRSFFGVDGLLFGTLDEEGFLTRYKYDAAGRQTITNRFANAAASSLWASGTLVELLANIAPHATDISTQQVYDGRNRVIATIDGEGNVTRYHYTARGDVDQEIRGQQVAANTPYTMATLPAPTGTLETTRFYRNAAGQVTSQVKTLTGGTETTTFTYDTRGRLLSQTTSETISTETRTQRFRYDVKGRLIGSLDGVGSATLVANPTDAQIVTAINTYGTRYNYNVADQLISRIDPHGTSAAGRTTRFYYDADGQLRFEINALGEVMEYRYNALEDRTDTFVYATRIDATTLTTLIGGLVNTTVTNAVAAIANASLDSREQYLHTDRGQLFVTYDPLYPAAPTADHYEAFYYNSFGEHVQTNQYLNAGQTQLDVATKGYTRRGLKYYDYQYTNYISQGGVGAQQQVYSYDAFGRTTVEYTTYLSDGRNNQYQYDRANRLVGRRDRFYNLSSFGYDARSNLISQTDRTGKVTTFAYDLFNRNVTTTSAEGIVSSIKKNAYGQTILITDGAGRTTSYTYDKNGNLKTVTDAAGTTTNNYDNADRLIETIDAKGVSTRYTYDAANRVLTRVEDFGAGKLNLTTTTVYDAKGQSISMTDALGVVTTYTYDLKGQKTRIVQDSGAGKLNITTDFVYRSDGKVIWQTDAVGTVSERKTFFEYDDIGRLTRKTEDQGSGKLNVVTNYYWDGNDNLVATSDNLARVTRFVYDLENRLQFTVNAEGEVTENGYDAEGRVIWTRAYANKIAAGTLAGFGNQITAAQVTGNAATSASDRINRTMYDGDGRRAWAVDAENFATRFIYDGANNVVKTIQYESAVTTANGTSKVDLDNHYGSPNSPNGGDAVTTYAYDSANRLTDITSAFGTADATTTHFEMDALGQISYTTVAYGTADASQTYRVFDNVGRVTQETRALGDAAQSTTYFTYNAHGNVTSITDPRGFVITRAYDNLGRMLSETVPLESGVNATTAYQYDARGNRVKITDPRGNVGYFFYDGTDRLVQQVDPEGYVTETSYAIGSNVSSVKRYYNRANNIASVSVTVKATVTAHGQDATTGFTYDKADRVLTATDAMGFVETYWYDGLGNRTQMQNKLGGITGYTYDKNGRLRYEYVTQNTYNSSGTLTASGFYKNIYEYDARGNMVHHVQAYGLAERLDTYYAYDKLDRLITKTDPAILGQTPVTTYQYDKRGNVILMTAPDGGKTYSFYDDNNRKVAEISPVNTYTSWVYDANGNVTSQKIYVGTAGFPAAPGGVAPVPGGAFRETQFIYDRNNRLTETRIPGVRVGSFNGSTYVSGPDTLISRNFYDAAGNLVREQDANGSSIYHYYDKNGREVAKVDQENYLTTWARDAEGNVSEDRRFTNKVGTQFALTVSASSQLTDLVSSSGYNSEDRITVFGYDRNGRRTYEGRYNTVASAVSASGALSSASQPHSWIYYAYNGLGEVVQKTEATGDVTVYDYDNQGRMTSTNKSGFVDSNGNWVYNRNLYYYDGNNNLVREEEREYYSAANQRVTQYGYNGGKLQWVIDASGFQRNFWYNVMGQQTYDYYARIKSDGTYDTSYNGNLTSYDLAGRVVSQWQADYTGNNWTTVGPITQYAYNTFGEVATRYVGGSIQEQYEYDNAGRVTKTSAGDGVWKFLVYDANGNNTLVLQSNGRNMTGDTVDSALAYVGAIDTMSATDVVATITTYDKRNMALSTREPNRTIASADARVNMTQTLVRSRSYNAFGEVASEVDARGNTTNFTYNTMGRLTQKQSPFVDVTGENGVTTSLRPTENYYYDLSGRLIAMTDANGNTNKRTLLANTGYGGTEAKVLKEFRADGSVWETKYDVFGDARVTIDGLGRATAMSYDAMSRVTQITKPSGNIDYYAYDGLGQRINHWNSAIVEALYGPPPIIGYGTYGEPIYGEPPFLGNVTKYETTDYDIQGRVTKTVNFASDITTYAYNWTTGSASGLGISGGWDKTTSFANGHTASERMDSFGRMLTRTDQGGRVYTFSYNWAGQLTGSTSTGGQNISYTYYNTGKVATVFDNNATNYGYSTSATDATYTYDADGNRRHEKYNVTTFYYDPYGGFYPSTVNHQDAVATFDALNRMTSFTNASSASAGYVNITNKYDANGNVRNTNATYQVFDANGAFSTAQTTSDFWYKYDSLNRFVTTKGALVGGVITRGNAEGRDITYNLAGERATASRTISVPGNYDPYTGYYPGYTYESREVYTYNVDGRLTAVNIAEGAPGPEGGTPPSATGTGTLRAQYTLDAIGRTTNYTEYNSAGSIVHNRYAIVYDLRNNVISESSSTLKNDGSTYVANINNYYGLAGLISSSSTSNYKNGAYQSSATTTTEYAYWDGAVQSHLTVVNSPTGGTHHSYFNYDANGHLSSVNVQDGRARTVTFVNDVAGQVLERTEADNTPAGDPKQFYYYFNGLRVGGNGNNGNDDPEFVEALNERQLISGNGAFRNGNTTATAYADFDQSYDPINPGAPGGTAQTYVARDGDTLQSIASAIWGDASLWYMLAEANGLNAQSVITSGHLLIIPNKVANTHNNSSTFRPYDPNKAIGDVSPTTPTAPKPKGKKCGVLGMILLAAIAVAVTIVTKGAAAKFAASLLGVKATATAAVVVGGALAAAAGSVVSQVVGVATGLQDKFSFKGVALAAIGGAVGAGLGEIGGKLGSFLKADTLVSNVTRGMISSAATQSIAVATGLQKRFDWAGVAAAGAAAGVGGIVARDVFKVGNGAFERNVTGYVQKMVSGMAGDIASSATRSLIDGSDFGDNLIAALPTTIGSTIGTAVGNEVNKLLADRAILRGMAKLPFFRGATRTERRNAYDAATVMTGVYNRSHNEQMSTFQWLNSFAVDNATLAGLRQASSDFDTRIGREEIIEKLIPSWIAAAEQYAEDNYIPLGGRPQPTYFDNQPVVLSQISYFASSKEGWIDWGLRKAREAKSALGGLVRSVAPNAYDYVMGTDVNNDGSATFSDHWDDLREILVTALLPQETPRPVVLPNTRPTPPRTPAPHTVSPTPTRTVPPVGTSTSSPQRSTWQLIGDGFMDVSIERALGDVPARNAPTAQIVGRALATGLFAYADERTGGGNVRPAMRGPAAPRPSIPANAAPTVRPRGPDGRFVSSGAARPTITRSGEYPSTYRAGVRDTVLDSRTIQSGPNRGMILTQDGRVVSRNDPRITIEHKTPVVEHWNTVGYNSTRAERNNYYNNTDNLTILLRSDNGRGGGLLSASGVRYRQDAGPGYGR